MSQLQRLGLYEEVTSRIIAELGKGRLPWVRPWGGARFPCMMPPNAFTGGVYCGIKVLILWCAAVDRVFASQR
ncbi:ArdC-like ssDNA-binding domain-containing protein [Novosphingobium sp. BL-8A]|uniref:ArdC-like ssDNA-binding domain-containing protein n=1 Tax=Novosphingobium sp. BL-8A TaxID=3127639 RepID=UPI003756AFBA